MHYIYIVFIVNGGNMKKRYLVFSVIIIFVLFHFAYVWLSKGREVLYDIKGSSGTFKVKEVYTKNYKNDYSNYYIEIQSKTGLFNFEVSNSFKGVSYIIDDIKYFKNDTYECVLPIFNGNKILSDILCIKNNMLYHYSDLKNESLELDKFASSYLTNIQSKTLKINNLELYTNNLDKNKYMIVTNYHGIDIINSNKLKSVSLFENDVYTQNLKAQVGKYYVVADYNEDYDFHIFYRVDVTNNRISKIISDDAISLDSYIEGVVDGNIYLFDRDAKKQYKIDVFNKSVTLSGNTKKGILYYENGKFSNMSAYQALQKDIMFKIYKEDKTDNELLVQVGNKYSGYIYKYNSLEDGNYNVSSMHVQNQKVELNAFNLANCDRIFYTKSGLYYIDDDILYYYNPMYGNSNLIKNNEWKFNSSLNVYVYEK